MDGAIQRMVVNGEIWDNLLDRSIEIHNVAKFEGPPCASVKCLNKAICVPQLNEYSCECNPKYLDKDKKCNEE